MTRRRLARRAATGATLLALAAASSCGIGVDDTPRAIQDEATTTTAAVSPSSGLFSAVLYFVREGTLMPVTQELPDRRLVTQLSALLQPPSAATATNGLSTSIPAGTEVLGLERSENRATVDLSASFDNLVGSSRQQAIGQMVLTITGDSRIDTVAFRVEGESITVSSPDRGDRTDVTACDFANLLATPEEVLDAQLPIESLQELVNRRTELDGQCEADAGGPN